MFRNKITQIFGLNLIMEKGFKKQSDNIFKSIDKFKLAISYWIET